MKLKMRDKSIEASPKIQVRKEELNKSRNLVIALSISNLILAALLTYTLTT